MCASSSRGILRTQAAGKGGREADLVRRPSRHSGTHLDNPPGVLQEV